jgi:beta-xylosidase
MDQFSMTATLDDIRPSWMIITYLSRIAAVVDEYLSAADNLSMTKEREIISKKSKK